ncbi:biotin/lipoyl-containing protein [Mycoplasma amphoriforme]|uniref:Lipoyl-binding domain-containing protein n=1 Tax=Mycoplasma amphoriforme A39 TaxID=572419 RepID=A0A292IGZ5_9MOLU|nr:unnamed protein product [Mycoplasma amphoriforme A39]
MYEFKFTDIGEGLEEGKINDIFVKVGDTVKVDDPVLNVETDKVTSDIPTPVGGVIVQILVAVGQVIHVGDVIALIEDQPGVSAATSENQPAVSPNSPQPIAVEVKPEPTPVGQESPKEELESVKEDKGASVVGEVTVSNKVLPLFGKQKK